MNHIVIIGFMGSGKTRVGKRLAKDFNLPFVDVDRVVSKKMNLTMKEIFDRFGEPFYRALETTVTTKALDRMIRNRRSFLWGPVFRCRNRMQNILKKLGNCSIFEGILCNVEEETGKFQQQSSDRGRRQRR